MEGHPGPEQRDLVGLDLGEVRVAMSFQPGPGSAGDLGPAAMIAVGDHPRVALGPGTAAGALAVPGPAAAGGLAPHQHRGGDQPHPQRRPDHPPGRPGPFWFPPATSTTRPSLTPV
jgi:hypothetical protein